jgi:hypothetical protein
MRKRILGAIAASTLLAALGLFGLLAGGAAGGHGHGHNNGHGRIGYHFVVLDQLPGTSERLIVQGEGSFNHNRASGGGTFDHFLAGTGPPATLIATGTWKADDVVSWTPGLTHGVFSGGILKIHATVKPQGEPAIKNVLIEVDCNLGPAGYNSGKPEGVEVTFSPTLHFFPTSPTTGNTIFSLTKGHKH